MLRRYRALPVWGFNQSAQRGIVVACGRCLDLLILLHISFVRAGVLAHASRVIERKLIRIWF